MSTLRQRLRWRMDDVRWVCGRWLRKRFAALCPRLYAAYVALSPKHQRIREGRVLREAYRWRAVRKLSGYMAKRVDELKIEYLMGEPVMIGWDMAKHDD